MVSLQRQAAGKRTGPVASKRQSASLPAVLLAACYIVPVPLPGYGDRRRGDRAEIQLRRRDVVIGREVLVECDHLAGVSGLSSTDGCQRAVGHLLQLVEWLARTDALDQVRVLLLVRDP